MRIVVGCLLPLSVVSWALVFVGAVGVSLGLDVFGVFDLLCYAVVFLVALRFCVVCLVCVLCGLVFAFGFVRFFGL